MSNTSTIALSVIQPSAAAFSTVHAQQIPSNGYPKDYHWLKDLLQSLRIARLKSLLAYTLQTNERLNCRGVTVTMSDMDTVQKYKKAKYLMKT